MYFVGSCKTTDSITGTNNYADPPTQFGGFLTRKISSICSATGPRAKTRPWGRGWEENQPAGGRPLAGGCAGWTGAAPQCGLKGLSHEIDFENVDENWQILALTRAAADFWIFQRHLWFLVKIKPLLPVNAKMTPIAYVIRLFLYLYSRQAFRIWI